mgnify:FL=1|jgi:hypothetical protein
MPSKKHSNSRNQLPKNCDALEVFKVLTNVRGFEWRQTAGITSTILSPLRGYGSIFLELTRFTPALFAPRFRPVGTLLTHGKGGILSLNQEIKRPAPRWKSR